MRWCTVDNAEGCYEVSNGGKVRRVETRRVLVPMLTGRKGNQYETVTLCLSNTQRRVAVHRLVAEFFLPPNHPDKPLVLHKDGNRRNNRPSNLYWGDQKNNMRDARKHHQHKHKLNLKQVEQIRRRRANGEKGNDLAAEFNVSPQYVCDIHAGRK